MRKLIQVIAIIMALLSTPALAKMTPLHEAAQGLYQTPLRSALAQTTPLHEAVRDGNRQLVIELIEAGADIEARDEDGWTPLHSAAKYGTAETVDALMDHGADGSARTVDGLTPFDLAEEHNQVNLNGTDAWERLNKARFR